MLVSAGRVYKLYVYSVDHALHLTLKAPITTAADDDLFIYLFVVVVFFVCFFFQRKQVLAFHVNRPLGGQADDSHEMSRLVFSEK